MALSFLLVVFAAMIAWSELVRLWRRRRLWRR